MVSTPDFTSQVDARLLDLHIRQTQVGDATGRDGEALMVPPSPARTVVVAGAGLAVVVAVVLATRGGPSIVQPEGGAWLGIPRVTPGQVIVIGGNTVCLDEPGEVPLESVTAVEPNGVEVLDFAVRDNPGWAEGDTFGPARELTTRGDLLAAGFDPDQKTLTLECDEQSGRGHEIGVEFRAPVDGRVGMVSGFDARAAGDGGQARINFGVVFCPDPSAGSPRCQVYKQD